LRRAGFTAAQIRALQNAFSRLFRRATNLKQALAVLEGEPLTAEVRDLIDFIRASKRGVCMGPRRRTAEDE